MLGSRKTFSSATVSSSGTIPLVLLFLWCATTVAFPNGLSPNECHPAPNAGFTQYIIGYGSLMKEASKRRTNPEAADSVPVRIKGFQRIWDVQDRGVSKGTTYLGITNNANSQFNGVMYSIPSAISEMETLARLDAREVNYCRQRVELEDIQILAPNVELENNADYWIYATKDGFSHFPSEEYPIIQSYVDTFISGCIEIGDKFELPEFPTECISSTVGWSSNWVNDRVFPRRAFLNEPKALEIDRLLSESVIGNTFRQVEIEA